MKKIFFVLILIIASSIIVSAGNGDMVYYNSYNNQARLVNLNKRLYQTWEKRNNKWYIKKSYSIRKIYNTRGKLDYYTSFKRVVLNKGGQVYFTYDWKYYIGSSWDPSLTKVGHLWRKK